MISLQQNFSCLEALEFIYFLITAYNNICGIIILLSRNPRFISIHKNKKLVYTVRKVRHHDHFIRIPNLAKKGGNNEKADNNRHEVIVLCSGCNVNTYQSGFLTRNDLRIGIHNGGRYDFVFLSDMVSRVGHTQFKQIDKKF